MQITKEPVSYYREGLSHVDLFAMFPNEKISLQWFEGIYFSVKTNTPISNSEVSM